MSYGQTSASSAVSPITYHMDWVKDILVGWEGYPESSGKGR